MAAGEPLGLEPGHTSTIRRIEGALLSYRADADAHTDPFELNLGRLVDLDMDADFIGKAALRRIKDLGPSRRQVGLVMDGPPLASGNTDYWDVMAEGERIGMVTSAIHSPRLEKNIALALIAIEHAGSGTTLEVLPGDRRVTAEVVDLPFYDPGNDKAGYLLVRPFSASASGPSASPSSTSPCRRRASSACDPTA